MLRAGAYGADRGVHASHRHCVWKVYRFRARVEPMRGLFKSKRLRHLDMHVRCWAAGAPRCRAWEDADDESDDDKEPNERDRDVKDPDVGDVRRHLADTGRRQAAGDPSRGDVGAGAGRGTRTWSGTGRKTQTRAEARRGT